MDILVNNIESFKEDNPVKALIIFANGEIEELPWCAKLIQIPTIKLDTQAVALPSHGRLIDADKVKEKQKHSYNDFCENVVSVYDIDNAPTVIEAST